MAALYYRLAVLLLAPVAAVSENHLFGAQLTGPSAQPGDLDEVVPCVKDQQDSRSLCVIAKFKEGGSGTDSVSCQALKYDPERQQAPGLSVSLLLPRIPCDRSETCEIAILPASTTVFEPGNKYDVFCFDWRHFPPTLIVTPDCTNERTHCGVTVFVEDAGTISSHESFGVAELACVILLMSYVGWSYFFDRIKILHETGAAVLLGLLAGFIMERCFGETVEFSYDTFSYVMLPMVIFAAGFNLEKQNFFKYISYILTLGVTGTVLIFIFIYYGSELLEIQPANGDQPYKLHSTQRLVLASVLSSTDSVAPMAFLSSATFPQLYAVVFGEGVLNDVVSILLSASVEGAETLPSLLDLSLRLLKFSVTSLSMGLAFGLATSLLFKYAKPLRGEDVVKPVVLLLGCNYTCYILAEICDFSSIFSLFVCAVVSGHYAQYGMSPSAQTFTRELAELMSYSAEAVVFGYFGLTAVAYVHQRKTFHWGVIIYYILCIVCARIFAILFLAICMRLLKCGGELALSMKELCVVAMAGCMRGTIAFALILRAVPPSDKQTHADRLMVTTVLGIVLINCLVFGGIFPLMLKLFRLQPSSAGNLELESNASQSFVRQGVTDTWTSWDQRYLQPRFRPAEQELVEARH